MHTTVLFFSICNCSHCYDWWSGGGYTLWMLFLASFVIFYHGYHVSDISVSGFLLVDAQRLVLSDILYDSEPTRSSQLVIVAPTYLCSASPTEWPAPALLNWPGYVARIVGVRNESVTVWRTHWPSLLWTAGNIRQLRIGICNRLFAVNCLLFLCKNVN